MIEEEAAAGVFVDLVVDITAAAPAESTEAEVAETAEVVADIAAIYNDCVALGGKIRSREEPISAVLKDLSKFGYVLQFASWPQSPPQQPPPQPQGWTSVCRVADLLVGFYLAPSYPRRPTVRLNIGGAFLNDLSCVLEPGAVVFALNEQFALPLIGLQFHETCILLSDPEAAEHCSLVYAYLRDAPRQTLALHAWHCRPDFAAAASADANSDAINAIVFARGMCTACKTHDNDPAVAFCSRRPLPAAPDWRPAAKRAWIAAIRADLMAAAWHPRRMAYWMQGVMDEDDLRDGEE